MNRDKFISLLVPIVLALGMMSCGRKDSGDMTVVSEFPIAMDLAGYDVDFDSVFGIPGGVEMMGGDMLFYLYESDHFVVETDSAFTPVRFLFPKGQGPGEMTVISGEYGDIVGQDRIGAFNPHACKILSIPMDGADEYSVVQFGEGLRKSYEPRSVQQLKTGRFAAIIGTDGYDFGMVSFDSCGNNVEEWPIGFETVESPRIRYAVGAGRDMSYNEANGVVAEIYSGLPYIVLHNEDGTIRNIISTGPAIDISGIDPDDNPDKIESIVLTDNYIYVLCPVADKQDRSVLCVMDYNGNGVAKFTIDEANSFGIDTVNRRLVALNPNVEIPVRVYPLPEGLEEPCRLGESG
ncbi:MAG: hypothetical protein HDR92_10805 [Bacteroides sp.]|nr:hypothetical protein [Bacteroides sp.]